MFLQPIKATLILSDGAIDFAKADEGKKDERLIPVAPNAVCRMNVLLFIAGGNKIYSWLNYQLS
jgi:hypothetical protein